MKAFFLNKNVLRKKKSGGEKTPEVDPNKEIHEKIRNFFKSKTVVKRKTFVDRTPTLRKDVNEGE